MTQLWYNSNYLFRRGLQLSSSSGAPAGHFVDFVLDDDNKVRSDFQDIVVVYYDPISTLPQILARQVTPSGGFVTTEFQLVNALFPNVIDTNYFVYFGNPQLASVPTLPVYTTNAWPINVSYNDPDIAYTRPTEHWRAGVSNHKGALATYVFLASKLQLICEFAPNHGIIWAQMDGGIPIIIDLYSPFVTTKSAYEWDNLTVSSHTLQIQVSGLQNAGATASTINIVGFNLVRYINVIDNGEEIRQLSWTSAIGGVF